MTLRELSYSKWNKFISGLIENHFKNNFFILMKKI